MLKSMTGYGRREAVTEGKKDTCGDKIGKSQIFGLQYKSAKTSWLFFFFWKIKSESMYRQV